MTNPRSDAGSTAVVAAVCWGIIGAQYVGALATRDALFLTTMDVAARPAMVAIGGAMSILLLAINWRLTRLVAPATMISGAFAVNACLVTLDWALISPFPRLSAQLFFLHTNALGPVLGSGFWLVVSERFDARTAKTYFGRIAAAGTIGGLIGAFLAARISDLFGVAAMLPTLSVFNLVCGWQVRRLTHTTDGGHRPIAVSETSAGWKELAAAPYIRILAALVLLGTMSASFVEHLVNVKAQETLQAASLPRFFSTYYGSVSLLVVAVQAAFGSFVINRFGLSLTMSSSALALAAGGLGALFVPGLVAVTATYGLSSVLYESLSRKGYEVFFTPVPAAEKRAIKTIVDVAPNRLGVGVSAGLIALLTVWRPERLYEGLLIAAIACSAIACILVRGLNREYVRTLERNLLGRRIELDLDQVEDVITSPAVLRVQSENRAARPLAGGLAPAAGTMANVAVEDPEMQALLDLRSRDPERILPVLESESGLMGGLVHHVIPLLGDDRVAERATLALCKVAEEHVGELVDALVAPNQPLAVRRRLPRVLSTCVSQRAADGLLLGLEDMRFGVRFECGRSLATIREKNPFIRIAQEPVFDTVLREIAVGQAVWRGRQALDARTDERSIAEGLVVDRAHRSLTHVFTLLSLVLPAVPLRIAYRGLDDPAARGTALEYLESVLPRVIGERLWPFLGEGGAPTREETRQREDILADLLKLGESR